MQHTFFVHLFAVVLHDYDINFQKLSGYIFYGGNIVFVLVQFFFSLSLIFTLVATSISHFLTAATKFLCCSFDKKRLLCFFSLALALFLIELLWPVALLSLFLCLFLSLNTKFVNMTINLSLIH